MSAEPMIVIEEIEGKKRKLTLLGASMPARGASWERSQRLESTFYPGNKIGTQQVLGPKDLPSTWSGHWSRNLLGRSPARWYDGSGPVGDKIVSPTAMVDLFGRLLDSASKLRVTFSITISSSIAGAPKFGLVREGRISNFRSEFGYADDVDWQVTFDWIGTGESQRVVSTRRGNLEHAASALRNLINDQITAQAIDAIHAAHSGIPNSSTDLTLGQLEALLAAPLAFVDSFFRSMRKVTNGITATLSLVRSIGDAPFGIANSALAFAVDTQAQANQFVDSLSRKSPEQLATSDLVEDLIRGSKTFGSAIVRAQTIAAKAQETQLQFRFAKGLAGGSNPRMQSTNVISTIIAIYKVKSGDTLPTISKKFYGVPDHATDIAITNHLPWYQVTVPLGKVLLIPAVKVKVKP